MPMPVSFLLAALFPLHAPPPAAPADTMSPVATTAGGTPETPAAIPAAATFTVRSPATSVATTQPTTRPAHDRDPWVFRCVLDNNPRMLVISLGDHWWMAFNTVDCSIYKIWNGEIELTGAVYDTKHGPQPKAKGTFVINGRPSLKFEVYPGTKNWPPATKPSDRQPIGPVQWRGYEVKNGYVRLNWDVGPYQLALVPINQLDQLDFKLTVSAKANSTTNERATKLPTIVIDDGFSEVVWPPVLNFEDDSILNRRPTFQIDLTPNMSNTKEPAK